jgi:hypothetical protein
MKAKRLLVVMLLVLQFGALSSASLVLAHRDPPGPPGIITTVEAFVTIKDWSDPFWAPDAEVFVTAHISMEGHIDESYGSAITEDVTSGRVLTYRLVTHMECSPATEVTIDLTVWEEDGLPGWLDTILGGIAAATGAAIGVIKGTAIGTALGGPPGGVAGGAIGGSIGGTVGLAGYIGLKKLLGESNDELGTHKFVLGENSRDTWENNNVKIEVVRTDRTQEDPLCEEVGFRPPPWSPTLTGDRPIKLAFYDYTLRELTPLSRDLISNVASGLLTYYSYGIEPGFMFSKYGEYASIMFEKIIGYTQMTDIVWNQGEEKKVDEEEIKRLSVDLLANIALSTVKDCIASSHLDETLYETRLEKASQALKRGDISTYFKELANVYIDVVTKRFPEFNPPLFHPDELAIVTVQLIDETSGALIKNLHTYIKLPEGYRLVITEGGQANFVGFIGDRIEVETGFELHILGLYKIPVNVYKKEIDLRATLNEIDLKITAMLPGLNANHLPIVTNYGVNIVLIVLLSGLAYKVLKRLRK